MAVSNVGNEGWARMAAMMEVAKAKNPSLTGGDAAASVSRPAATAARPAELARNLPANSPMVMRTYAASGVRPDTAAQPTKALGSRFDAYA